jgi:hypothetical protein
MAFTHCDNSACTVQFTAVLITGVTTAARLPTAPLSKLASQVVVETTECTSL